MIQLLKAASSGAINNFVIDAIYLTLIWLTEKGPPLKEREMEEIWEEGAELEKHFSSRTCLPGSGKTFSSFAL